MTETTGDDIRLHVPLLDSAERVGVLSVTVTQTDDPSVEWWLALASLFGELIVAKSPYGDALTSARRIEAPSLAAEMRWTELPPLTFRSPELTITGIFEPAYDIAGDTFDYALQGTIAHVALFDAMGHGLEASMMANLAVGSYRRSRRLGLSLDQMGAEADAAIADQFGDSRYVTAQLATFDIATGELRMVNMGHPPPLWFRGAESLGPIACRPSLPLGLGGHPTETAEVTLEPGDVVVFHTDGVADSRDPSGTPFGTERLTERIASLLAEDTRPSEILRRIVLEATRRSGRLEDDATLVLLGHRLPIPDLID